MLTGPRGEGQPRPMLLHPAGVRVCCGGQCGGLAVPSADPVAAPGSCVSLRCCHSAPLSPVTGARHGAGGRTSGRALEGLSPRGHCLAGAPGRSIPRRGGRTVQPLCKKPLQLRRRGAGWEAAPRRVRQGVTAGEGQAWSDGAAGPEPAERGCKQTQGRGSAGVQRTGRGCGRLGGWVWDPQAAPPRPCRRCRRVSSPVLLCTPADPLWKGPLSMPGGARQSPVDICRRDSLYDPQLRPLSISYAAAACRHVWNTGYFFQVEFDDSSDGSGISGGPLQSLHRLRQLHFHWGAEDARGSEHTVDGRLYPAEVGAPHSRAALGPLEFGEIPKLPGRGDGGAGPGGAGRVSAAGGPPRGAAEAGGRLAANQIQGRRAGAGGLALLHGGHADWGGTAPRGEARLALLSQPPGAERSLWLRWGARGPGLQLRLCPQGARAPLGPFQPACLLPACRDYWTYPGSLTTPPLAESVTWIILREPVPVAASQAPVSARRGWGRAGVEGPGPLTLAAPQLAAFRSLLSSGLGEEERTMGNNFRPLQPLMSRRVRASFRAPGRGARP
ncbi:Carbonic anhydrase 5A, mitochondrial [Galemys pyrenaicus]|uniref:Carbonic anhydrase 5A, mitochondrial n=1 Tax=Galemys pyrenaicus TaxID=202257 RepID=A0A8J6AB81_GALPY|nr:Carbonic anhydrase 5A, mitochondrial [Galemys pyrenaicus]